MDYKKSVGGIDLIPLITNLDILYALYVNYDKKCRQYRISSLYIIVIKRLMPSRANQRFMEIMSFKYLLTYFIPSHSCGKLVLSRICSICGYCLFDDDGL